MAEYLMMDALTAATLRGATGGEELRLDPRAVANGPHAGEWALPIAVLEEPAFEWLGDVLAELARGEVAAGAWPALAD